ncbi:von Willebrand factor A domain-containing protein 2-like isoform X2 [Haliotis rufescens]|uniref:von Willebrand factor A domain-containing protein 2-like isoform X2 n=1 Tax=Haliotis rufescens TaxID=6454 RepID=UPI001EAFFDB4|nr:von Willebrand factor A domain-containing protein 2-like isoform X2 [Haliotis rufescens]
MEKDPVILLLLLLICHSCWSQDPCENFTELDNIESRQPTMTGNSLTIHDSQLPLGWYAAPVKWKMLSRDPGSGRACGNSFPLYRKSKTGDTSQVCLRGFTPCVNQHTIETRMCGDREIYRLTTIYEEYVCFTQKPCANGGTCTDVWNGYSCACLPRFSGVNCTVSSDRKLDILIVEDVSRSIGKPNFDEMKRFQESMVNSTTIGRDAVNVALIAFSSNARVVFRFTEYSNNKSGVLAALQQQIYEEGPSTNIGDAIKLATSTMFIGDRNDADNKVIMFTDGYTTMEDRGAIAASIGSLKAKAEVFVVAISEVDANSTIHLIASRPSNIFQIGSPDAVSAILQKLMAGPVL